MPLPRFDKLDAHRKKSILAAAAEEFGEHGFANASYNRIIERAGISKGAMYYYFADKDDLYRTVLEAAVSNWIESVGFPVPDGATAEAYWQGCRELYVRSLRFLLADPCNASLCLSVTRARARMEGHQALLALNNQMIEWTRALVGAGQSVGAVRSDLPTELMVQMALALMDAGDRWLASTWHEVRGDDVEQIADTLVGLMRRVGEKEAAK